MARHTKGPWEVRAEGEANRFAVLDGNSHWLLSFLQNGELLSAQQKANAELLAASPDMFAALEAVNEWAHKLLRDGEETGLSRTTMLEAVKEFSFQIWPLVDAALAKADREYVA